MTREEAIEKLKNTAWLGSNNDRESTEEAVRMAIEALQNLSKPNNGLQGSDLISRQDIKYHVQLEAIGNGQYEDVEIAYRSDIESLPSADRPKGRWLSGDCKGAHCSACDEYTPFTTAGRSYPYCPNCGARMF